MQLISSSPNGAQAPGLRWPSQGRCPHGPATADATSRQLMAHGHCHAPGRGPARHAGGADVATHRAGACDQCVSLLCWQGRSSSPRAPPDTSTASTPPASRLPSSHAAAARCGSFGGRACLAHTSISRRKSTGSAAIKTRICGLIWSTAVRDRHLATRQHAGQLPSAGWSASPHRRPLLRFTASSRTTACALRESCVSWPQCARHPVRPQSLRRRVRLLPELFRLRATLGALPPTPRPDPVVPRSQALQRKWPPPAAVPSASLMQGGYGTAQPPARSRALAKNGHRSGTY
jgi:hypothetical protein